VLRVIRLCIVTVFGERLGGSDNVLWTFLRHLDRDRFDPTVIFLGPGAFEREVAGLGIETQVYPPGRLRNPVHAAATVRRLRQAFREARPELILNWLSTAHIYAGPAAAMARLRERTLWWQHDLSRGGRRAVLDQLANAIPAVAVGACSQAAADLQASRWPHRRVFAVHPGIDDPHAAGDVQGLRARLDLPDGLLVGSVGRLFEWKGHHLLVRALARLRAEGHQLKGVIVGGGGHRPDRRYEEDLRAEVRRLGLSEHVVFTGHVANATPYVEAMDVLVNASAGEPFGLVLLEAMALGTPVLAVADAGPAEIIRDGTGVLVPSNSPEDLAEGLGGLLVSEERRRTLAVAGRGRWEERFTGERMTREMEDRLLEFVA
jgi:glycosyltransferase involved in cell wall biosynthesis